MLAVGESVWKGKRCYLYCTYSQTFPVRLKFLAGKMLKILMLINALFLLRVWQVSQVVREPYKLGPPIILSTVKTPSLGRH